jgi:hypothetical protein
VADILKTDRRRVHDHVKYLEMHGHLRRISGGNKPIIYEEGPVPFGPDKDGDNHPHPCPHGGWWEAPLIVHNDTRKFLVSKGPSLECAWSKTWTAGGVKFHQVKPYSGQDKEGVFAVGSVRYVEGPRVRSLVVNLADAELASVEDLKAFLGCADMMAQRAANRLCRQTGMVLGLMEIVSEAHYLRKLPRGVGRAAKADKGADKDGDNHGASKGPWVDESSGPGEFELETSDPKIARYLLDYPRWRERKDARDEEVAREVRELRAEVKSLHEAIEEAQVWSAERRGGGDVEP